MIPRQKLRFEKIDRAVLAAAVYLGSAAAFLTSRPAAAIGSCPPSNDLKHNCIVTDLNDIINFLSAGVGIVVVGTIVVAGIQYTTAGENATKVEEAKKRIISGIVALVAFLLTFAVLQWLIPGGL